VFTKRSAGGLASPRGPFWAKQPETAQGVAMAPVEMRRSGQNRRVAATLPGPSLPRRESNVQVCEKRSGVPSTESPGLHPQRQSLVTHPCKFLAQCPGPVADQRDSVLGGRR